MIPWPTKDNKSSWTWPLPCKLGTGACHAPREACEARCAASCGANAGRAADCVADAGRAADCVADAGRAACSAARRAGNAYSAACSAASGAASGTASAAWWRQCWGAWECWCCTWRGCGLAGWQACCSCTCLRGHRWCCVGLGGWCGTGLRESRRCCGFSRCCRVAYCCGARRRWARWGARCRRDGWWGRGGLCHRSCCTAGWGQRSRAHSGLGYRGGGVSCGGRCDQLDENVESLVVGVMDEGVSDFPNQIDVLGRTAGLGRVSKGQKMAKAFKSRIP